MPCKGWISNINISSWQLGKLLDVAHCTDERLSVEEVVPECELVLAVELEGLPHFLLVGSRLPEHQLQHAHHHDNLSCYLPLIISNDQKYYYILHSFASSLIISGLVSSYLHTPTISNSNFFWINHLHLINIANYWTLRSFYRTSDQPFCLSVSWFKLRSSVLIRIRIRIQIQKLWIGGKQYESGKA